MDSLADRLKSLGFKPASTVQTRSKKNTGSLEEMIQGVLIRNSVGSFVLREQLFPYDYHHGDIALARGFSTKSINQTARIEASENTVDKMIFLDTETSGLSGGAGTFAFMVGIGRFSTSGFVLQQYVLRDPSEEPAMLLHLSNILSQELIFVTFNGKSFDIPLIQNRLVLNRLPMKIRNMAHLDLLHLSRKLWRKQLTSCTLKDLEASILHFTRSSDDVPGWMIPDIYFDFLRTGDPTTIADVVYHNAQDIVSLAALFIHISKLLEAGEGRSEISTSDLIAISRIYWDLQSYETALTILMECNERKLNREQKKDINALIGQYYKLFDGLEVAVDYWKSAAESGDAASHIELAMYYEHKVHDINTAITWSRKCAELIENSKNLQLSLTFKNDLLKRIKRLEKKRSKNV